MNTNFFNNIGICSISIMSLLGQAQEIELAKVFLAFPMVSHADLLSTLARKGANYPSLEKLIALKPSFFTNFNRRYYDSLLLTMNSLLFLIDTGFIKHENKKIVQIKELNYNQEMGARALKIYRASENIKKVLSGSPEILYVNLRIEL